MQNRELNRQLAYLSELARMRHLVVLLVSQVHSRPLRIGHQIEPVARRILTHWSEVVLRLSPTVDPVLKMAQLERYGSTEGSAASCFLRITERGLEKADA